MRNAAERVIRSTASHYQPKVGELLKNGARPNPALKNQKENAPPSYNTFEYDAGFCLRVCTTTNSQENSENRKKLRF
jgi:hypothetical protein